MVSVQLKVGHKTLLLLSQNLTRNQFSFILFLTSDLWPCCHLLFLVQGPFGRSGLPGLPGADGPPVCILILIHLHIHIHTVYHQTERFYTINVRRMQGVCDIVYSTGSPAILTHSQHEGPQTPELVDGDFCVGNKKNIPYNKIKESRVAPWPTRRTVSQRSL